MPVAELDKPSYSPEWWTILFSEFYNDAIIDLANDFPNRTSLVVSFEYIDICWGHRGSTSTSGIDYVTNNPDNAIEDANEALRKFSIHREPPKDWDKRARVEISGWYPVVPIREIRANHQDTFVCVTGIITRKTGVNFALKTAAFECVRCTNKIYITQLEGNIIEPYTCDNEVCGRKGPFKLLKKDSEWVDKRKIRLQETFESITDGEQTLGSIDAVMIDGVECPALGTIVIVSGILRGVEVIKSGSKTSDFTAIIEVNHIEASEDDKSLTITEEDEKEMSRLSSDPNIVTRLASSLAPSIKGYLAIKEGVMCAAVSGENYLLPDGRELRGYTHIAICGDPSTGKSMIMQATKPLVPRAQYASGRGATAKGLTVSVTKDSWGNGTWVAEAGMLVLADRSMALIDELDKFKEEEMQELNSALASGRIPVNKAGINREFFSRCPVIAGMNPKHGRFDISENIIKQVKVPPDTLSRFDLVFCITQSPRSESNKQISKHISRLWGKATRKYKEHEGRSKDVIAHWEKDEYAPDIPVDLIKKWIIQARKIDVEITPECEAVINEFFDGLMSQWNDDSGVPVVFRHLDGMMRLLIAETRLRHGDRTELRDARRVMELVMEGYKVMVDPLTGKIDSDIISTGISKSQRDRFKDIRDVIMDEGDNASMERICEVTGLDSDDVEGIIDALKHTGEVVEIRGVYRWVG